MDMVSSSGSAMGTQSVTSISVADNSMSIKEAGMRLNKLLEESEIIRAEHKRSKDLFIERNVLPLREAWKDDQRKMRLLDNCMGSKHNFAKKHNKYDDRREDE